MQIAGFTVDNKSLSSGTANSDNYVYLGTDGLKVGNFLSATKDGASFSGEISVNATINKRIVKTVKIEYGLSDFATVEPTEWEETAPSWNDKKYMWQKITSEYTDGSIETKTTCIQGAKGQDAITCFIDSSQGTSFPTAISDEETTVLTAYLYQGLRELDPIEDNKENYFTYNWYYGDNKQLSGELNNNGKQITVKIIDLKDKNIYVVAKDNNSAIT